MAIHDYENTEDLYKKLGNLDKTYFKSKVLYFEKS